MLIVSVCFLLFASVIADRDALGVVNGTEASIHDHPWMVSTWTINPLEGFICGGFLVALDWALTAAYCQRKNLKIIHAGSQQRKLYDPFALQVNITKVIRHPNFTIEADGTLVNDLALLHLSTKVIGSNIFPIGLPEADAPVPEGQLVNVTGWGLLDYDKATTLLHTAEVLVTPKKDCQEAYRNYNLTVTDEEQFCVGTIDDTAGFCTGDGGGPIEYNGTAIGLISWGLHACSLSGMPGVVVNIAHYVEWIRQTIENSEVDILDIASVDLVLLTPVPIRVGIINGTNAEITDHPWMVSLYNEYSSRRVCGGSLIFENWVLTAAHCAHLTKIAYIGAGSARLNETKLFINVTENIVHPNFTNSPVGWGVLNDVALLRLAVPIKDPSVSFIALPQSHALVPELQFVNVTGWGYWDKEPQPSPNTLQVATLQIPSKETCIDKYKPKNGIIEWDKEFCVGTFGDITGTCSGDSRGPAEFNGTVIGVVSWAFEACSSYGYPGVFANVANYVDWIRETTGM